MTDTVRTLSRRGFLSGTGALVVAFSFQPSARESAAADAPGEKGLVRVRAEGSAPAARESWLVLTADRITVYSGKVELGTGIRTALTQMVVEELRLDVADVAYVQGDTLLSVSQQGTTGSKSLQEGGIELRQAAATAYRELLRRAAARLDVPADRLTAENGSFRVRSGREAGSAGQDARSVSYRLLLESGVDVVPLDATAPLVPTGDYRVVGRSVRRVELPGKLDGRFRYLSDLRLPGMLYGRVIRPPGRNATDPVVGQLARAQAVPGFVAVVREGRFVGVVAESEWAAARAAAPATGITVAWTPGPALIPQAELATALRDPANHYRTVLEQDGGVDPVFDAADTVLTAEYFTPFHMHGAMGASSAVADVRESPDPETGIQATVWASSQNVTNLRGSLAHLLGIGPERVRVLFEEASGCYGHNGADDAAADAVLLSRAARRPVQVQWTRQNEHAWEPLGGAQAHDMRGALGPDGITAWSHRFYAVPASSRPQQGNSGTLLAGALTGRLPAALPQSSVNNSGRNAPVTYGFPQRVEARLVKPFETTGTPAGVPAGPLVYRLPRTSSLRSLGGFSNNFANESFFDEMAHAGGHDPLELRIASLPDPRAVAVCRALRSLWRDRPRGTAGVGAGVAFQQYEVHDAYAAAYAEVEVDLGTGRVRVRRVVVAHDCGLIVNPDGLRNQIEGNVMQGVSRTLKEEVRYTADRVTSVVWESNSFNPTPQYEVLRFDEIPVVGTILINRPDKPPLGGGEPTIGTIPGALANAVFAATGKRIRSLPLSPERVRAALGE
ncbi:xanthine dehydrogenase family protein molybdopterin-binding subunit [Streptomyces liangshanensis]|uniref:xanthine dehydrogenase family protein molybdopterin-binding subunit n=1 Tax=Streptomyces liangshanensis TaxID=2717324 RepID=UPI0036D762FD